MEIIKSLLESSIKHLIYENEVEKSYFIENAKKVGIECISVLDARSAVYFATGMSAQNKEVVVVCINSVNSRSAFSGMTEAFYRKLPVILVTLGNSLDYSKELRDAVVNHYVVLDDTDLSDVLMCEYPIHIEITDGINCIEKTDCNKLISMLTHVLNTDDYLYISQKIDSDNQKFECKTVRGGLMNSVDGALSNVLGASLAGIRNRYIGLVSEVDFLHDMNALGNINMNDLILYFVITKKKNEAIYNYAKSLEFEVVAMGKDTIEENHILQAINNGKKTIFMVCEET